MDDLQLRGLSASDRKVAERLERTVQQSGSPNSETGTYNGVFDSSAAQGARYQVDLDDGSQVYGEFITPSAPPAGTTVACYHSGNGKWLFDCL